MIFGIGTDIAKVSRFEKWVNNPDFFLRFFNQQEISEKKSSQALCQHYAARFAAKEAFSKALGTGITAFELKDVFITNDKNGKPLLHVEGKAKSLLQKKIGAFTGNSESSYSLHVSLSHEKEYAIAFVIIEV